MTVVMFVLVLVAFLVRVIELVDFDIARHHEDAAIHAHHVDRRAVQARKDGLRNDLVDGAERRASAAEIQHAVERIQQRIELVRREQHGDIQLALHAPHEFDHARLMPRIETDERFVQQQQARIAEQTLREQQPLTLAPDSSDSGREAN